MPKNIILILSDALRADRLGCYGNHRNVSPIIDACAENGILFENAFTVSPITNVSVASLLTGCYPFVHGVRHHTAVFNGCCASAAEILKNAGYHTGAVISCATLDRSRGLSKGFDYYDDRFGPEEPKGIKPPDPNERSITRHSKTAVSKAIHWINSLNRKSPFFLFLHLMDTHSPFNPNPEYFKKFPVQYRGPINGTEKEGVQINLQHFVPTKNDIEHLHYLIDGELYYTNTTLSFLLDYLKREGIFESTAIVFTADHGCHLGEKGIWGSGRKLYDLEIRIPLIFYGFETGSAHRHTPLISNIDIFPTIFDLLGLRINISCNGRSRAGEIIKNIGATNTVIYSETFMPALPINWRICVRNRRWKLICPPPETETVFHRKRISNVLSQAKTLVYRLTSSKTKRLQQIKRAFDFLFSKKELRFFERIDRLDSASLGNKEEFFDMLNDPSEINSLAPVDSQAYHLMQNERIFHSRYFILGNSNTEALSGQQLDEARDVLRKLGYI
jgi:arylsulfatase A-like enzyme